MIYQRYSQPFFGGDYRVLRGGSWAVESAILRPSFRNWDHPYRRQIFSGARLAWSVEGDAGGEWVCMFALDIYDWRDLGSHTAAIPSRGCVGMYLLPDRSVPEAAARDLKQSVLCQTTMSWIHSRRSGRRGFERD
jgi:hypothetical protein